MTDANTVAAELAAQKLAHDTSEAARTSLGQRRINLIWESTQAIIAISVVLATLSTAIILVTGASREQGLSLLSAAFFLIIGFYFGRTNHARTGGVSRDGNSA